MRLFIVIAIFSGFMFNLFHDYLIFSSEEAKVDARIILVENQKKTNEDGKISFSDIHSNLHMPYLDYVTVFPLGVFPCVEKNQTVSNKIESVLVSKIFKPPRSL